MKIAVTTPTGQIGSKLANLLLDRKSDITVIARHPEKVKALASRGAKVIPGVPQRSCHRGASGARGRRSVLADAYGDDLARSAGRRRAAWPKPAPASFVSIPICTWFSFRVQEHSCRAARVRSLGITKRKRSFVMPGRTSSRCARTSSWKTCSSRCPRSSRRTASTLRDPGSEKAPFIATRRHRRDRRRVSAQPGRWLSRDRHRGPAGNFVRRVGSHRRTGHRKERPGGDDPGRET